MNYISFSDYQNFGGKCDQQSFSNLQYEVESKLNYITCKKLELLVNELESVPESIKRLEVKLINTLFDENSTNVSDKLTSYSNGIESFGYDTSKKNESVILEKFTTIAHEYLYEYPELFYRGRWLYRAR